MTTVRRQNIRKNHTKSRLLFFACLAALLLFAAAAAEHLCPYDPYAQDYASALCPPSPAHPFGTDRYGRDMLSRVIMGAKTSVFPRWFWCLSYRFSALVPALSADIWAGGLTR